jgi:hypothetical protein
MTTNETSTTTSSHQRSSSSSSSSSSLSLFSRRCLLRIRLVWRDPSLRKGVVHLGILLYFLFLTLSSARFFSARSIFTSGRNNTLCRDHGELGLADVDYCMGFTTSTPAVSPSSLKWEEEMKGEGDQQQQQQQKQSQQRSVRYSKFLLFETDAWPIKYAKRVVEHLKEHAVLYLIDVPGAKFSHAIYTSHLTGQPHTNYKGEPIKGDSLIRSMKRAKLLTTTSSSSSSPSSTTRTSGSGSGSGYALSSYGNESYPLRYVGPEWSYLSMLGPASVYKSSFVEVDIQPEPLDVSHRHPYPFFFESGDIGWFYSYLFNLKQQGLSMISHSGVFDHRQHGEHRRQGASGKKFPYTDMMADTLQGAHLLFSTLHFSHSPLSQHPGI